VWVIITGSPTIKQYRSIWYNWGLLKGPLWVHLRIRRTQRQQTPIFGTNSGVQNAAYSFSNGGSEVYAQFPQTDHSGRILDTIGETSRTGLWVKNSGSNFSRELDVPANSGNTSPRENRGDAPERRPGAHEPQLSLSPMLLHFRSKAQPRQKTHQRGSAL